MDNVARCVVLVFGALVGVVCIALGTSLIGDHRYLVEHGVRTRGVVVANHRVDVIGTHGARSEPTYQPQVRYVGPSNHTYVVEGEGRPTPQFRVGDSATIYYDPQDPQRATVDAADTDNFAWVMIGGGCVMVVLAIPWPLLWRLRRLRMGDDYVLALPTGTVMSPPRDDTGPCRPSS
jgi:hypothetical protein